MNATNLGSVSTGAVAVDSVFPSAPPALWNADDMSAVMNTLMAKLVELSQQQERLLQIQKDGQQVAAIKIQELAYRTKSQSIKETYTTEVTRGAFEIASGVVSLVGAAYGSQIPKGGSPEAISAATTVIQKEQNAINAFSRGLDGSSKPFTAQMNEDAQMTQLAGDFEEKTAKQREDAFAQLQQQVVEMRQKMREALQGLTDMHDRMTAALKA